MKYEKPQLLSETPAIQVVRGRNGKPVNPYLDSDGSGSYNATIGGYEADE